jgi:hypothetical protein
MALSTLALAGSGWANKMTDKYFKVIVTREVIFSADSYSAAIAMEKVGCTPVFEDIDKGCYELTKDDVDRYGLNKQDCKDK